MKQVLLGAITMADMAISLHFLKFWRTTKDRFFLFFAFSFFVQSIERLILATSHYSDEQEPLIYLMRLIAYLAILLAILDKNRRSPKIGKSA